MGPSGHRPPTGAWAARRGDALATVLVYVVAAVLLFGIRLVPHFATSFYRADDSDPKAYIWAMEWWPHAVRTLSNPLLPDVVTGAHSYDLAWAGASIPGPSLVASPVTGVFGPIVAFNLWVLLGLVLSSLGGYLLCREVGARHWPSVLGGFLFGFSSFTAHHALLGHLNFTIAVAVPIAAALVVRHLAGRLSSRRFVALLAAVLVWQFLVSTEVFFTMTCFGALALLVLLGARMQDRRAVAAVIGRIGIAYGIALAAMAPVLVTALAHVPAGRFLPPEKFSADAADFVIPPRHDIQAYLGVALLVAVALFAASRRRRPEGLALAGGFTLVLVLATGPVFRIRGATAFGWPWGGLWRLPLFRFVVPVRLVMFGALVGGLIVALWISGPGGGQLLRWGLGLLCAALVVARVVGGPAPGPPDSRLAFFADGTYRRYISPGDTVVAVPFDYNAAVLWQAEARMGFQLVYPFLGVSLVTAEELRSPVWRDLRRRSLVPGSGPALERRLRDLGVDVVLVSGRTSPGWLGVLRDLHAAQPASENGLTIYRIPVGR